MKVAEFTKLLHQLDIQFTLIDAIQNDRGFTFSHFQKVAEELQRKAENDFNALCQKWLELQNRPARTLDSLILEK